MKKALFFALLALLFLGCAVLYTQHESRIIVFKSAKFSYADAGFVHSNANELHIEILMAGHPAFVLHIGHSICFNGACMSPKEFNQKYLSDAYPDDMLKNIFMGKPLFEAKNRVLLEEGFTQELFLENQYDIAYEVKNSDIRFKDRINQVLIKSRKIEE